MAPPILVRNDENPSFSLGHLEFAIPDFEDDYWALNDYCLEVKFKIVKQDGTNWDEQHSLTDPVGSLATPSVDPLQKNTG